MTRIHISGYRFIFLLRCYVGLHFDNSFILVYTLRASSFMERMRHIFFFSKDGMLDWIREHQRENIANEMKATKPWIEATREVLGLLIMILVLLVNYLHVRRMRASLTR